MTSNNQLIVNDFKTALETQDNISLSDMKKLLTKSFNKINKKSTKKTKFIKSSDDEDGGEEIKEVEKPKKAPSAYNLFFKEKMNDMKDDKTITGKEKMAMIAVLWKQHKEANQ